MRYVAIDLGSSFTKGAILDTERLTVSLERQLPTPGNIARVPTRYEIDPEVYFQQVQTLLDALLEQAPNAAGVLFSTQMHGFVLSGAALQPLTPYVSWRDAASSELDNTGKSYLEQLRTRLTPDSLRQAGVPCKGNLALSNLFARLHTDLTLPDCARFHTLGSYMTSRLGAAPVCHLTNAAPTGLADIRQSCWNTDLLARAGCDGLILPRITNRMEVIGQYQYRGRSYPLYPDLGDHQCCVLGSLTRPETDWNINIGTAGLLGLITRCFAPGDYETRPFFDGYYLRSISGLPGGRHLDLLAGFLADVQFKLGGPADPGRIWDYLVHCDAGSQLEVDLQDYTSQAAWIRHIGPGFCLDDLIGGTYAYMAHYYRRAAGRIGGQAGCITFSGGCALRNPALRQRILTEFNLPENTPVRPGEVMAGLLQLALTITGQADSVWKAQALLQQGPEARTHESKGE